MFQRMIDKSMAKSPWIFHINAGSCNGCDIELVSVLTPRYDAERLGFRLTGTPRQADIVVVSGPVTSQTKDRLVRTLAQVPEPRVVVSLGSCPRSGNVFKGSYCVDGPLEKYTHVDVSVGGCTPKPEAIMAALAKAAEILAEKRKEMRQACQSPGQPLPCPGHREVPQGGASQGSPRLSWPHHLPSGELHQLRAVYAGVRPPVHGAHH